MGTWLMIDDELADLLCATVDAGSVRIIREHQQAALQAFIGRRSVGRLLASDMHHSRVVLYLYLNIDVCKWLLPEDLVSYLMTLIEPAFNTIGNEPHFRLTFKHWFEH